MIDKLFTKIFLEMILILLNGQRAESKARLVLNRLERGLEPSDLKQGQEWQETLEKARDTNIKPDRLERGIGKIKEIIQRIKEKYSLKGKIKNKTWKDSLKSSNLRFKRF